jgi:DNA adenine methylase
MIKSKKHHPNQLTIDGLNMLSVAARETPPPSAVKWSGGKRSCARSIARFLPTAKCFYEPFFGGGSVLYCRKDTKSMASDLYAPLVDFWLLVKNDPRGLIENYHQQWTELQKDLPAYFYVVRERFNKQPNGYDLCFLSRTCVNGIIRFNDDGKFNNSFHLSRKGMTPDRFEQGILLWAERLRTVEIKCCDYAESVSQARKGDLVYMDPPYVGSKQRYIADLDINRLLETLESLNKRGVRWALSFDGMRGESDYRFAMPKDLFKQEVDVRTGLSAITKVLNGAEEHVTEKLYLNF